MAYKPSKGGRILGIIGVVAMAAAPIIYLLYRIAFYA